MGLQIKITPKQKQWKSYEFVKLKNADIYEPGHFIWYAATDAFTFLCTVLAQACMSLLLQYTIINYSADFQLAKPLMCSKCLY